MSYAPRHRKVEPTLASSVVATLTGRHSKVLTGVAIAVPTAVAGIGATAPANAAVTPVTVTPQTAAVTAVTASAAVAGVNALPNYYAGGVDVLHYGSTGNNVKTVQGRLGISRDGSFGPITLRAVKGFQARKGLAVDGYVGPATWRALGGYPGARGGGGGTTSGSSSNARAAQIAYRYIGIPYVWGGSTPRGFDCSGLTSYVYRQAGKSLPRSARAQQAAVRRVASPQVGDLVFYGYPAHHVGIYVGNGYFIDSPKPGTRVTKRKVYLPEVSSYGRP